MPLNAVLFDMDGVIVDTEPLHRKAYFKMFEDFNVEVSDELYATFAGATTRRVCNSIIETFKLNAPIDELFKVKRQHFKDLFYSDSEFDLIPGVRELIQHYHDHKIKMVLASSASHTTIDMVFEKFQLKDFFIGKLSGEDFKASKPHPEIFEKAAEMAQEEKANCMVIEDSTNGIKSAHSADIFCAGFSGGNTHLQDFSLADIVITDYKELEVDKLKTYFEN